MTCTNCHHRAIEVSMVLQQRNVTMLSCCGKTTWRTEGQPVALPAVLDLVPQRKRRAA